MLGDQVVNGFDPFESRRCRDIRNQLSEGFLTTLETHDLKHLQNAVSTIRVQDPTPEQADYLEKRLSIYASILSQPAAALNHVYTTARLLWDAGLFFECHEWLEPAWMHAGEPEKQVLQALIRAAAFYVLTQAGRHNGARKAAAKAAAIIESHRQMIPDGFKPDFLAARLRALDPTPPKLATYP